MTEKAPGARALPSTARLLDIMARLRDPNGGCPWDVEQTFRTIAPYTIEEAYEVADAIERDDMALLCDELGDLLLQVVFHARMAEEDDRFDFEDVAAGISDKMVRRHPHVFGDASVESAAAQTVAWEDQKAAERDANGETADTGVLANVPVGLPALTRAVKLQRRAARVGFDWPDKADVMGKIEEEQAELVQEMSVPAPDPDRLEDEMGDLLFVIANLARWLEVDPEAALRRTNAKFERRFREVERRLAARGKAPTDSTLEEMDALWTEIKTAEKAG